jgi:hypothetical protein
VPKLLANKRLPLPRFWIPYHVESGDSTPRRLLLTDGILPDPEESFGQAANPSLKTLSSIETERCFALLGQPGLGKSMAVEEWVATLQRRAGAKDLVILLRGRGLASPSEIWRVTVDSPRLKEARRQGGEVTLVLDGLDEALQRLPVILSTLRQCLDAEPVERTRLVLVSRIADWRDSRAQELFALWPEPERGGAYELCPLRWKDVRLAARESGLREDAFARAVMERRVAWMAGRPKLLLMLIDEYRAHRRLPDSRRKLFTRAALRMCEEHDPERHEVLERSDRPVIPAARVYPVVARINALLLLSGKSHVLLGADVEMTAADIPLEQILGGCEPLEDAAFEVDRAHVSAALDSSHFVACGPGRVGFDHQPMAEFMAAEYLRRCTTPQLRSLLTQRVDATDYLLPQFREVSAWIAVQHKDFCTYLLSREPRFLLDADAVELDEVTRRHAVAALLDQMDREEAFDGSASETFLKSLHHPQLTRQLRPYIVDPARNVVVRRTAIRLAGAARCKTLKADLWRLLGEPQQVSVRRSIIEALGAMATPRDTSKFLGLLRGDFFVEIDEELRGEALEFLVPRYLPVRAALKYLVPGDDSFFGTYWRVLAHHLPTNVELGDVLPILRECNRRGKGGRHPGPLKEIADAAVKLALRHFDDPNIRQSCIRFLATQAEQHSWRGTWDGVRPAKLSPKRQAQLRRTIMEGFVKLAKGKFSDLVRFNLWPKPDDLGWFLGNVRRARGAQRGIWADLIARLTYQPIPTRFRDDLIQTYESVTALREKLPKPRRFDLIETLDRRRRAVERWREVEEKRNHRNRAKEAECKLTVAKCFEYFREERIEWWPSFTVVLRRFQTDEQQSSEHATARKYDISTWHEWLQLSNADRRLARRIAAKFLQEATVPPREHGTCYIYDEAAVRAIVLLGNRSLWTALCALQCGKSGCSRSCMGITMGNPNSTELLSSPTASIVELAWLGLTRNSSTASPSARSTPL